MIHRTYRIAGHVWSSQDNEHEDQVTHKEDQRPFLYWAEWGRPKDLVEGGVQENGGVNRRRYENERDRQGDCGIESSWCSTEVVEQVTTGSQSLCKKGVVTTRAWCLRENLSGGFDMNPVGLSDCEQHPAGPF